MSDFKTLGTRSWIRIDWNDSDNTNGYNLYWSVVNKKPATPGAQLSGDKRRYYIQNLEPDTRYYIWLESKDEVYCNSAYTTKQWELDSTDVKLLSIQTSKALPHGMTLFWNDEFNDEVLNRNKWSTNYYSTWDFMDRTLYDDFKNNTLPQPAIEFTGNSIVLKTNDSLPERAFWASGRKISSIQTYDWNSDENLLDNSKGGYFEARIRRRCSPRAEIVNTAFWFDSPGPDLKYYLEKGVEAHGAKGIRTRGQVFEIDLCEYMNTEIVLHGNVDSQGKFQKNIGHFPVQGVDSKDNWVTHGMLWSPSGLKFYINGELKKEWTDLNDIKSPNHFMNLYLGAYGKGGEVSMEVDYIRFYQWPLQGENELPNPGFDYSSDILPWTGSGTIRLDSSARKTNQVLSLLPDQSVNQYVYLIPNQAYKLRYKAKGAGRVEVKVSNLTQVTGEVKNEFVVVTKAEERFTSNILRFQTEHELKNQHVTVLVSLKNVSSQPVFLDDVELVKE